MMDPINQHSQELKLIEQKYKTKFLDSFHLGYEDIQ